MAQLYTLPSGVVQRIDQQAGLDQDALREEIAYVARIPSGRAAQVRELERMARL